MTLLVRLWHGFLRLFGLDACPLPPQAGTRTPQQQAVRSRLGRLLRRG